MSNVGFCGLSRNYDALPPDAYVLWNGTKDRVDAQAAQRPPTGPPALGRPASPPGGAIVAPTTLQRLYGALQATAEPAVVIADRALVRRQTAIDYLWKLAQAGRINGGFGDNPRFGQVGQPRRCWLYWKL